MNLINRLLIIILILISSDSLAQKNSDVIGDWNGKLKDGSGEFEYILKLENAIGDVIKGTSISKSATSFVKQKLSQ